LLSLRWKLGGALLLVVLVSVGIMAFLTNQNTTTQFQNYLQSGNRAYTQRLVESLEQFYTQRQNWNGAQEVLIASLRTNSDRLALADISSIIVADTASQLIGKPSASLGVPGGTSITVSGQVVGILYLSLSGTGAGRGYMGGRGGGSNSPAQANIQTSEGNFLSRINNYIWIAGIISIAVALLLGIFLTRQVTRPLQGLNAGAKHISEGDLKYRVKVHSNDEIGQVAASFNNMAVKLENSEESRRRLVSDVAHELRTPLTIIQGTVDGIKDGVFQPDEEHLDSIREQTVLLTHLVNDLRDLSLAESGQLKLDLQPSDIVDLVRRKITQFEVNARKKNIRLLLQSQPAIPLIRIDTRRIEQVLGNLLSNAIRHAQEGGQITVSLETLDAKSSNMKHSLKVSVTDTGEGIPAEHLPYIFERFYRVETSRSRSQGGAGLGLAIVKQMVQAHGGQVWVESQAGHGSTFYFSLPFEA
jgi:signal transduction histidine kinase